MHWVTFSPSINPSWWNHSFKNPVLPLLHPESLTVPGTPPGEPITSSGRLIDSEAPPSRPPVIQSVALSRVKPASISQHCPKKREKPTKPVLSVGDTLFVAVALIQCQRRSFPARRRRVGFSVPTRKSSSTDRDVTGAWQVSWLSTFSLH